jgi:hypothetical protein
MLYMLDSLPTWTAHSEHHEEDWAGSAWSSIAFKMRSLFLPGARIHLDFFGNMQESSYQPA